MDKVIFESNKKIAESVYNYKLNEFKKLINDDDLYLDLAFASELIKNDYFFLYFSFFL